MPIIEALANPALKEAALVRLHSTRHAARVHAAPVRFAHVQGHAHLCSGVRVLQQPWLRAMASGAFAA